MDVHLDKNEEAVLAIIRELYLNHKTRLPINWIYSRTSREGMPDGAVKIAIRNLSLKNMIYQDGLFWKPIFDPKQEQAISASGVHFDLSKILNCIRKINRPTKPNEVLMKFIELYGMPDNVESFLRYMRTIGEDPTSCILRNHENKYWIKNKFFRARDTTLSQFSAGYA